MTLLAALRAIIAEEKLPPRRLEARHVDPASVGRGIVDPRQRAGTRRIVITLEDATFERIRDHAARSRISFAAATRELIGRGFDRCKS